MRLTRTLDAHFISPLITQSMGKSLARGEVDGALLVRFAYWEGGEGVSAYSLYKTLSKH